MNNIQLGVSQSMGYENVEVKGIQEFLGKQIPVIYGGFGSNQKVVTDKTVSEIHDMKMFKVRERINENIKRFKEGIDLINIKRILDTDTLQRLGYVKQSITQAENIYLLSERGYAKLIKIMDSDLAWEIHDQLMDEYFSMREERVNPYANLSPELQMLIKLEQGQTELNQRVGDLENNMTIDYSQQETLRLAISTRVYQLLGSAKENVKLRSKVYSNLHRFIKKEFSVNSYKNIAVKEFERARALITTWLPDEIMMLAIEGARAQMSLM